MQIAALPGPGARRGGPARGRGRRPPPPRAGSPGLRKETLASQGARLEQTRGAWGGAGFGSPWGRMVNLEPMHTDIKMSGDVADPTDARGALSQVEPGPILCPGALPYSHLLLKPLMPCSGLPKEQLPPCLFLVSDRELRSTRRTKSPQGGAVTPQPPQGTVVSSKDWTLTVSTLLYPHMHASGTGPTSSCKATPHQAASPSERA
ncbi:POU domain, class 2, transcription factor 3 [Tupaia chinensis]|uniref:POU domain, class 2, transcription factor 3 n=1 Tax=Tupaia chinensis TaxID=246437 RepID=L9KXD8_TUPCH|nr:POU domain, class 2, transcription factor 3 [Tupaia chinensis]